MSPQQTMLPDRDEGLYNAFLQAGLREGQPLHFATETAGSLARLLPQWQAAGIVIDYHTTTQGLSITFAPGARERLKQIITQYAAEHPPALRYVRAPHLDKRIARGDDFAGDAWLDTHTGEIVFSAVGADRNAGQHSTPGGPHHG